MAGRSYVLTRGTATCRKKISGDLANMMREVRQKTVGENAKIGIEKAVKVNGVYTGGINFERHPQAINLHEGPRCYPLSTSTQNPKEMNAPQRGRKTGGKPLDEHGELVRSLLEVKASFIMTAIVR